ncbi:hypothetical protein [Sediminibacterium goheungense]|uniref:Uncharacterized protein n=1 Tax=Sediminibacterium goheungense TaxID=1086393 RepID=A0A4R6ITB6_9BACT|nr:hypothetical protein [Sediminibacterium goheungense]TDO25753.1 hypothetical protein BC659_2676 [Sediminibacterium goheungense]
MHDKRKNNSFWNNNWTVGTGTAIISVLILRIIDSTADTKILNSTWRFIKALFINLSLFFQRTFTIPTWGLILIAFSGLGLLILVLWIGSLFNKNDKDTTTSELPVEFLKYKSDTFDNLLYKWEYIKDYDGKYDIVNFTPYCPKDNCILHYSRCPICNTYFLKIKEKEELRILVRHRIENNLYPRN